VKRIWVARSVGRAFVNHRRTSRDFSWRETRVFGLMGKRKKSSGRRILVFTRILKGHAPGEGVTERALGNFKPSHPLFSQSGVSRDGVVGSGFVWVNVDPNEAAKRS